MAYQKLQPERAYLVPAGVNFDITKDNPFLGIKQRLYGLSDLRITVTAGVIDSIEFIKPIYEYQFYKKPTITIGATTGSSASYTLTVNSTTGAYEFTKISGGSGYPALQSNIYVNMTEYTVVLSSRLQPFMIYTNNATTISDAYSANGDSLGEVSCNGAMLFPLQMSSFTSENATKGSIALW
jgi:hypothetical protein